MEPILGFLALAVFLDDFAKAKEISKPDLGISVALVFAQCPLYTYRFYTPSIFS
tara:strand:- start:546 stop:707 length:162 start_codon:yes stop_codon:yes gene_type:complete